MRKLSIGILLLVLAGFFLACLSGCSLQKICEDRFPPTPYDSIVVRDSIIHDTITVMQPYEELFFTEEVPCPPQAEFKRETKKNGLTSTVTIKGGKIAVTCKQDSVEKELIRTRHQLFTTRSKKQIVEKRIEAIPRMYKGATWCCLFLLILWLATIAVYEVGKK